ncbi:hypothetical protein LHYA1_G004657 [Lachnellula hyalina]|uniref:Heterokaryon incompatibility domain-containing protein n=1 Tax=Lachnellula hyalina TaxID=1316788 RepID=A0A8H8R485_9HELO|nr:uncharacterized protein LHYA1_G004657 [Lachnellula hyalina]TVY27195.1 hypothetical protein LHYA1_G004657 [Lachnellula hyalina]
MDLDGETLVNESYGTMENPKKNLCAVCTGLNLSVDKFMIKNDSVPGKKFQVSLPPRHASRRAFSLKSGHQKQVLGSRKEIRDRSDSCPFCELVSKSLETEFRAVLRRASMRFNTSNGYSSHASNPEELDDAPCHLVWEIDGRGSTEESFSSKRNRTRRIKICWGHPDLQKYECYLVFVAPDLYTGLPNSDAFAMSAARKSTHFLGRSIDPSKGKQALIKSWWDLCKLNHGSRCNSPVLDDDPFHEVLAQSYFGVIDVIDMRLVSLPYEILDGYLKFEDYVALSYVWGIPNPEHPPYTTTRANIMEHRMIGGLERSLPKLHDAIRESIAVVQRLGIRYIWIDSLCIVQDSRRSWSLNARVMHLIYGNATLTICAADGEDASTGLLAMDPDNASDQLKAECAPGVHLMVSRPPEIGVQQSRWNKRAWTFQERLLSKRCLIFTQGRIYFQCRSTGMSEDIFADGRGSGWSLDSVQAPLQMLRELRSRALWFYTNCVSLYSSRELTESGDVLAAFSGVCSLMEGNMMVPFVFGLPSSHLDLALLWEPASKMRQRDSSGNKNSDIEFPSWSWCGWMGAKIEYRREMVDGCLENVHEWLVNHTWIVWHIRDGHGNLRPLWDKDRAEEDRSTETRWKGYRGRWPLGDQDPRGVLEFVRRAHTTTDDGSTETYPSRSKQMQVARMPSRENILLLPRKDRDMGYEDYAPSPIPSTAPQDNLDNDYQQETDQRKQPHLNPGPCDQYRINREYPYAQASEELVDIFGRAVRAEIRGRQQYDFNLTLPENPFRVLKAPQGYSARPDNEFPDQPVLQFWTWITSLHVIRADTSEADKNKIGEGLCRCDIADGVGDWCGSIIVDNEWIKEKEKNGHTMCEFVALSEAKAFTEDECPVWTYYIPKERHESTWDLFFVLLVRYYPEKGLYQRVGLGKVYRAAFRLDSDEWREMILG